LALGGHGVSKLKRLECHDSAESNHGGLADVFVTCLLEGVPKQNAFEIVNRPIRVPKVLVENVRELQVVRQARLMVSILSAGALSKQRLYRVRALIEPDIEYGSASVGSAGRFFKDRIRNPIGVLRVRDRREYQRECQDPKAQRLSPAETTLRARHLNSAAPRCNVLRLLRRNDLCRGRIGSR
jgi:hypothetical protein